MKEILDELKLCLYTPVQMILSDTYGDFEFWLLESNCSKVGPHLKQGIFENERQYVVYSCLKEILDVLMENPEADHFWYTYQGGKLTWSEPHHDEVPLNSLRVDKQKIKVFLRNIRIEKLGI